MANIPLGTMSVIEENQDRQVQEYQGSSHPDWLILLAVNVKNASGLVR
jgi:hypothetical protein